MTLRPVRTTTIDVRGRGRRPRSSGSVRLRDIGESTGEISYELETSSGAGGMRRARSAWSVEYAFAELGLGRVQARVATGNVAAVRVARRAGLRNEGVVRVALDVGADDYALLARLRDDPSPIGARRVPRAAQLVPAAQAGHRPGAGPRRAGTRPHVPPDLQGRLGPARAASSRCASRPGRRPRARCSEELGLRLPLGRLVLTDWMPPWGGWDDALCLVFDGGVPSRVGPGRRRAAGARDPGDRVHLDGRGHATRGRLHGPPGGRRAGLARRAPGRLSRSPVEPSEAARRLT